MAPLLHLTSLIFLVAIPSCFSSTVRIRPPIAPYEWPCPNADDIVPCVCSSDEVYNLFMDCSLAFNADQLSNAFLAIFPFNDFTELTINQESSSDKLDFIPRFTFQDITFERIIIKYANMTYIDEEAFTMSKSTLRYLDLSYNVLRGFPFETIPNYVVLDTLILDENQFADLPPITSQSLKTLSVNGISNLFFTDLVFTEAPSLSRISMSRIDLQSLYTRMFETLQDIKFIDLSQNNIAELDVLSFNPPGRTIQSIALYNNSITFVRPDAIHGLTTNCSLNFMYNGLIDLTEEVWKPIFDEAINGIFDFTGNPLRCGCEIAWIMLDEGYDNYRPLISETTLCNSGEQLVSLDVNYFETMCRVTTTLRSVNMHA